MSPRHQFDQVSVHPTAIMAGSDMGMSLMEIKQLISECAEANPAALIGGYNIDLPIVATYAAIRLEGVEQEVPEEERRRVIQSLIEDYYQTGGLL